MNKIFYTLGVLLLSQTAFSQTNKNQVIWSLHAGSQPRLTKSPVSTVKEGYWQTNHVLDGELSYFVKNGMATGVAGNGNWDLAKATYKDETDYLLKNSNNVGSVTPFVRKYWTLPALSLYAGAGIQVSLSKYNQVSRSSGKVYGDVEVRQRDVSPQLQVGGVYPITRRLGVGLGIQTAVVPVAINSVRISLVSMTMPEAAVNSKRWTEANPLLNRGRIILTGTFGSTMRKKIVNGGDDKTDFHEKTITGQLSVGYLMSDRVEIGLRFITATGDNLFASTVIPGYYRNGNKPSVLLGIHPYLKRYFTSTKLTPYLKGSVGYERIVGGRKATGSMQLVGSFGLAYFPAKRWMVDGQLINVALIYSKMPDLENDAAIIHGKYLIGSTIQAGLKPQLSVAYFLR